MLGLVELEHQLNPQSTWDKFIFILESIPQIHEPTALVAFLALGALVFLRFSKVAVSHAFPKYLFWVRYIPEVLFIVVASTCECERLYYAKH